MQAGLDFSVPYDIRPYVQVESGQARAKTRNLKLELEIQNRNSNFETQNRNRKSHFSATPHRQCLRY